MLFAGDKKILDVYKGTQRVEGVYKGQSLVWRPHITPSEQGSFKPDEHHPVDTRFQSYYNLAVYLWIKPERNDKVKILADGVIGNAAIIPRAFPLFGGPPETDYAGHLEDYRLYDDKEYTYDYSWYPSETPYQYDITILNCERGEYRQEGSYHINTLYNMQGCVAGLEGVDDSSWSVSYSDRLKTWYTSNRLAYELYVGDYAGLIYLGEYAFGRWTNLKNIRLPSSLQYIGPRAYQGCISLETVDLRNCASLQTIDEEAFKGCTSLEKIILPRLSEIDQTAFDGCTRLKTIVLLAETPPDVTPVGQGTEFVGVTKSLQIKVKPESVQAYSDHPVWGHYIVQPYTQEDFVWEYINTYTV